jgi:two-component sensor histidine kinase
LALHELATNAMKYGALSQPGGQVSLFWSIATAHRIRLVWSELGGPPPAATAREGFGSQLLRNAFRQIPGGDIQTAWAPHGMTCEMVLTRASDLRPQAKTAAPAKPALKTPANENRA